MKVWIDKARRPEMVGRHRRLRRALRRHRAEDASTTRCWPPPPTASAPRWRSRRRWTSTTPSASTWSACSSTTSSSAAPSRCSSPTTSPPAGSCPSGSPRSCRASPRPACRPAARWSAARPPSTPGLLGPDEYDVAGSTTGVVEAADLLGPGRVEAGDVVIAMASSGLHSNGYSLVRHVLLSRRPAGLVPGPARRRARPHARRGAAGADHGSTPRPASTWPGSTATHAMSHVTGGGLAANLARVLPEDLVATLDRGTWTPAADLRPGPPGRLGRAGRPGAHPELRRRDGRAHRARRRRRRRRRCSTGTASPPGSAARCGRRRAAEAPAGGSVTLRGQHPGW